LRFRKYPAILLTPPARAPAAFSPDRRAAAETHRAFDAQSFIAGALLPSRTNMRHAAWRAACAFLSCAALAGSTPSLAQDKPQAKTPDHPYIVVDGYRWTPIR
jgi:hypothetical protein